MVHIPDVLQDPEYTWTRSIELAQYRTMLGIPLLREGVPIGVIALLRRTVRPFTDKQIELVKTFADQAVIAIENVRLFNAEQQRTRELSESLEQQTATSEVLKVISSSPGELEPVFEAILENATRICQARFGTLHLYDGEAFRRVALHNPPPQAAMLRGDVTHPHPESGLGYVVRTKRVAHMHDIRTCQPYLEGDPAVVKFADLTGARTVLAVPMLKENELIGVVAIYRQEVRPFIDKQIELVQNFAAQAVIAIENTRLLNELRQRTDDLSESLEQQTGTSEVLKVISSTPGELKPVFDAMLANATRICDAAFGNLVLIQDDIPTVVAMHGAPRAFQELWRDDPRVQHGAPVWDVVKNKSVLHIPDIAAIESYASTGIATHAGARTFLGVPMLKGTNLVGTISIYRQEVRPFTDKQIELVKNFAAQAVIAIENARLLNEQRESLERQTATSEVLQVISTSPGELGPVFNAILTNASRICEAKFANLFLYSDNSFRIAAQQNPPPEYAERWRNNPVLAVSDNPRNPLTRLATTKSVVNITDLMAESGYVDRDPRFVALVESAGARTHLLVPMVKDDELVGAIAIYRQEVRPFTEKQIELVTNFAKQAVIAIENTRLLKELRQRTDDLTESLEQQTATSEVLKIISSSPGDLEPVFTAMLENATRVCEAKHGFLFRTEGDGFRVAAALGDRTAFIEQMKNRAIKPGPLTPIGRLGLTRQIVHVPDLSKDQAYLERDPLVVTAVEQGGVRSVLVVPMIKDGELIGAIGMHRREVRPFTDKQIELFTNFASQAVIAIENTRLLNEQRESLERQTATSEVLKVISTSPGELEPVFQVMLENATRICEARIGILFQYEDGAYTAMATLGVTPAYAEYLNSGPIRTGPTTGLGRVISTRQTVHIVDTQAEGAYADREPLRVATAELGGARSLLNVPMLKEGQLIGAIGIYRQEVRPFTDKQIELVTNFASQAVIAIENTRLLSELRESLQQQTATADVLKVISSSPGELEPVFKAILANATDICGAKFGTLYLRRDEAFYATAFHNAPPAFAEARKNKPLHPSPESTFGRAARTKQVAQILDSTKGEAYRQGDPFVVAGADLGGYRTIISVPMLKDDELIGVISIYRQEVCLFTDKQIELVKNFASQAVIAIENTRLLNELRSRTNELAQSVGELQALGEVSQAVNSTLDLETVLTTIVGRAVELSHTDTGAIYVFDEARKEFRLHATFGMSDAMIAAISDQHIRLGHGNVGTAAAERRPVQVPDIRNEPASPVNEIILREGYRGILVIPLLRPDDIIGALVVRRKTPGEFPQSTIDLLQTFADQSVVAIQNARLYENVETRTRELAKSLEELRSTQDRLVQTQKLASLGQLTAGIAHEIKNPLNFVNNFSGLSAELIDELQDTLKGLSLNDKARAEITELTETLKGNLDKVVQHGKRADAIVKNMLLHSREGSGEHRPVDINALVEESLNLAWHGARAEKQGFNITLEKSFDPAAGKADVFPQDITRVLLNLISNGFYAAAKRKAEVHEKDYESILAASTKNLGDRVEITIRDNGTGIAPDVRNKMFNPFFTTKPAGEGTGLGLSISHDIIVKQHGGSIEVDTMPGEYTAFRITLPRNAAVIGKAGAST
jgi:GAF domain-containing protein